MAWVKKNFPRASFAWKGKNFYNEFVASQRDKAGEARSNALGLPGSSLHVGRANFQIDGGEFAHSSFYFMSTFAKYEDKTDLNFATIKLWNNLI